VKVEIEGIGALENVVAARVSATASA
jgi:citrate lyase gamma subunit